MADLKKLLQRDGYRCGIHSGGCGELIKKGEATKDHIVPLSYIRTLPNMSEFQKKWNYQSMHAKCNNEDRRGQIINGIKFKCNCHGIYIDDEGSYWIMYKKEIRGKNKWQKTLLLKKNNEQEYKNPQLFKNNKNLITIIPKEDKNAEFSGFSALPREITKKPQMGHIFWPLPFYERMLQNSIELERTEQWENLAFEVETFFKHWFSDKGKTLKRENQNNEQYAASAVSKFLYWAIKIKQVIPSKKFKNLNTSINEIKKYAMMNNCEYSKIWELAERQIKGSLVLKMSDKDPPLPIAFLLSMKTNEEKENDKVTYALKSKKEGNLKKAVEVLTKFISHNPSAEKATILLLNIKIQNGDYDEETKNIIDKAIDCNKKNPTLYLIRAQFKKVSNRLDEAESDAKKAMAIFMESDKKRDFIEIETGKSIGMDFFKKAISQELLLIECLKNQNSANNNLMSSRFNEAIEDCNVFFQKYDKNHNEYPEIFTNEMKVVAYSTRLISRILLKEGFRGICRISNDKKKMEKDIFKETHNRQNDLKELSQEIQENINSRIKQMVDLLVEQGILEKLN